jgi:hypothetical protein
MDGFLVSLMLQCTYIVHVGILVGCIYESCLHSLNCNNHYLEVCEDLLKCLLGP